MLYFVGTIAPPHTAVQPLLEFQAYTRCTFNPYIYTFPVRRHAKRECDASFLYVFASDLIPRADILVHLDLRLTMRIFCFADIVHWHRSKLPVYLLYLEHLIQRTLARNRSLRLVVLCKH